MRFCRKITKAFIDISSQQAEPSFEGITSSAEDMCLKDRMDLWCKNMESVEEIQQVENTLDSLVVDDIGPYGFETRSEILSWGAAGDQSAIAPTLEASGKKEEVSEGDEEDVVLTNPSHAYQDFFLSTEAYGWLLTRLRREYYLARGQPDVMQMIRQQITAALPQPRGVSRHMSSESYGVVFDLDWNPLMFLEGQEYGVKPSEAVEEVITLIGSCQNAQAVTCLQYMKQTWPLTGEITLQLIKDMLGGTKPTCKSLSVGASVLNCRLYPYRQIVRRNKDARVDQQIKISSTCLRNCSFHSRDWRTACLARSYTTGFTLGKWHCPLYTLYRRGSE